MRYRKRPVEVEAQCFAVGLDWEAMSELARWAGGTVLIDGTARAILIPTPEGTMRANAGDWIVCGVAGEHYPVKPDIFEATYEPVGGVSDG